MSNEDSMFRPGESTVSKLRFYSIGIVAENKALSSKIIEVTPTEELPMISGQITGMIDTIDSKGVDAKGQNYETKLVTTNTIQAEWLRLGDANRLTPPDVRRGESVIIYQFADGDKYYWNTLKNDSKLRKLETVVWGISATRKEGDGSDPASMYYIEFSSHTKLITLHTSQANGEKWGYDIQINPGTGYLVIKDTNDNFIKIDSLNEAIKLSNASGSFVELKKKNIAIKAPETITIDAKTLTMTSTTGLWKSPDLTLNSPRLKFT